MRGFAICLGLALGVLLAPGAPIQAQTCGTGTLNTASAGCVPVWYGQTPGGAYYTLAIPTGWTPGKGLVIWNHGFESYLTGVAGDELRETVILESLFTNWGQRLSGSVEPQPGLGPWRDLVLSQGYALVASSYYQTGWAVFDSHLANAELYAAFVAIASSELSQVIPTAGISPLYLIGASLGGLVTLRDLEAGLLPEVDGALLACGAVAGADNWRQAFDTRMVYEAVCADSTVPIPWYEIANALDETRLLQSLESCTALGSRLVTETLVKELQGQIDALGAIDSLSKQLLRALLQGQQAELVSDWVKDHAAESVRFARILELADIPTGEFLALDLWYAIFELPRLINEPGKLAGRIPFHNVAVDYGDADINRRITRSVAPPSHRLALQQNYTPRGDIGQTKLLAIHTSGDGLVRVENAQFLSGLVAPTTLTTAIVAEAQPSHCGFTVAEGESAWNELRAWVEEGAPQPTVQSLQVACVADAGADECRFNPGFSDYGPQVLTYPRPVPAATVDDNRFDAGTGVLSLAAIRDPATRESFDATLVYAPTPGATVFTVETVTPRASTDNWQPTAALDFAVDPVFGDATVGNLKLFVPDVQIVGDPKYTQRYNLYWRRLNATQLELLEAEEIPNP